MLERHLGERGGDAVLIRTAVAVRRLHLARRDVDVAQAERAVLAADRRAAAAATRRPPPSDRRSSSARSGGEWRPRRPADRSRSNGSAAIAPPRERVENAASPSVRSEAVPRYASSRRSLLLPSASSALVRMTAHSGGGSERASTCAEQTKGVERRQQGRVFQVLAARLIGRDGLE